MRPDHGGVMSRVMGGEACVRRTGVRSKRRPDDDRGESRTTAIITAGDRPGYVRS